MPKLSHHRRWLEGASIRLLALAGALTLGACGSAVDFSQWASGYKQGS